MKRWQYLRANENLTQVRKPQGVGFIGHSPQWIDVFSSPDFYSKQIRKGLLESLQEADERPVAKAAPEPKTFTAKERKKQATIDLENVTAAIADSEKRIKELKKKGADKDLKAVIEAELQAWENRVAVLKDTEERLEVELNPPKSGQKE